MKKIVINKLVFFSLVSLLASCASTPDLDTTQVDQSLTPQSIVAEPELNRGKTVLWGGTILDTRNMKDSTQIEVLAYPLNTYQRPLLESKPQGRFIIQHQGYLEPSTYAQGRVLSVVGKVSSNQSGHIGESVYTYAVINSLQLHLWSPDSGDNRTSFHFGIGVGIRK